MDPNQENFAMKTVVYYKIKQTNETQDQKNWIFLVSNVNYPHDISQLQQLIDNLQKNKQVLVTMQSSLKKD